MTTVQKYIRELQEYEIFNEELQIYSNSIPVADAIDILQRFEIELINQLSCEELEKLKKQENGFKKVS